MHFMNPQRAVHMGAPAAQPIPPTPEAPPHGGQDDAAGIGSALSGYATPDNGPFECGNCVHFQAPNTCDNPQVVSDPEVGGQVEAEGCCNLFRPGGGEAAGGEEDQETGAIPAAGEGGQ
jgi:hypothetical protein